LCFFLDFLCFERRADSLALCFFSDDISVQSGVIAIVTGSNRGIGYEVTLALEEHNKIAFPEGLKLTVKGLTADESRVAIEAESHAKQGV